MTADAFDFGHHETRHQVEQVGQSPVIAAVTGFLAHVHRLVSPSQANAFHAVAFTKYAETPGEDHEEAAVSSLAATLKEDEVVRAAIVNAAPVDAGLRSALQDLTRLAPPFAEAMNLPVKGQSNYLAGLV